jgi:hypothetical protein
MKQVYVPAIANLYKTGTVSTLLLRPGAGLCNRLTLFDMSLVHMHVNPFFFQQGIDLNILRNSLMTYQVLINK